MTTDSNENFKVSLKKDDILCLEGEADNDLYIVHSGKLLVFARKRSQVTQLGHIGPGEYFGELSFFDDKPRSADVIALEDTVLIRFPHSELRNQFPQWLITIAQSLANRLRVADDVIRTSGIKKKNADGISPMSVDEQGRIFRLVKEKESKN